MIKIVIFDCDGVLCDSERIAFECTLKVLASFGVVVDINDYLWMSGMSEEDCTKYFLDKFNVDIKLDKFIEIKHELFRTLMNSDNIKPLADLISFMKDLKNRNIKMAIASSSSLRHINTVMDLLNINEYIDFVVCGQEVKHKKPAKDIYALAIQKANENIKNIIAIEDSYVGISSAKLAGLYVVGFKASSLKQDTSLADEEVYKFSDIKILH